MRDLPDCPSCVSTQPLEAVQSEPRGVVRAWCPCCGQECRVDATGRIVWKATARDVSGEVIDGP
jgi:hypothetical protein